MATNISHQVGLTDYKDHMGTNLSPKVDQWVGQGEARWDHMAQYSVTVLYRWDHMSQCIGVGCWILSTDNKVTTLPLLLLQALCSLLLTPAPARASSSQSCSCSCSLLLPPDHTSFLFPLLLPLSPPPSPTSCY